MPVAVQDIRAQDEEEVVAAGDFVDMGTMNLRSRDIVRIKNRTTPRWSSRAQTRATPCRASVQVQDYNGFLPVKLVTTEGGRNTIVFSRT